MNDLVFPLVILPLIFLTLIVCRAITVVLHELGHALPALIFSKQNVHVYIGSYGQENGLVALSIGRNLTVYFKKNPFTWQKGVVFYSLPHPSFNKEFFITLLGPLTSFIVATASLWLVIQFDLHGSLKLFCMFFLLSALFDLRNIYPDSKPIKLNNGQITYCDGYQLNLLLNGRKDEKYPLKAFRLLADGKYNKAQKNLAMLDLPTIASALNEIIYDCIMCKQYAKAKNLYCQLMRYYPIEGDEHIFCNMGLVNSYMDNHHEALIFYNKALAIGDENMIALSNRAFTYNVIGQYQLALHDFDSIIAETPESDYAYANRGLAKIKLNEIEGGLSDLKTALLLNNKSVYAHRNLGIYYFEIGENEKALLHLEVAQELDPDAYLIHHYIDRAKLIYN